MDKKSNQTHDFLERRRQLLKMGAAGMPMILTLKASANQSVHSALDCSFKITSAVNLLVNHEGKVWVGDGSIRQHSDGRLNTADIASFKSDADFAFPSGSAPDGYVPSECPDDGCSGGGGDGDWDDDDWYFGGSGKDLLEQLEESGSVVAFTNNKNKNKNKGGGSGGDDDDDDCGSGGSHGDDDDDYWDDDDGGSSSSGSEWTDCGYNFYQISANTTITPLEYMNSSGDWQISGTKGLYIVLGAKYLDYYGNDGGFPGISCLHSILTYLETA
ncbi:hypothetical protein [Kordiimonas aestuarii]|uniref:hypothetical protein n=1 Tax=Kordiimonas aestuarii TaxID=1005925 RepID=UPI0021CED221|nr:hypothetical protein [Kordiimonas aestuarii]